VSGYPALLRILASDKLEFRPLKRQTPWNCSRIGTNRAFLLPVAEETVA